MASEAVWSVDQLISSQEDSSLSFDKKLELKRLGRPMPTFKIKETPNCRLSMHYEKKQWLTGCAKRQAFFCFPCLLFKFKTTVFSEPTRGISKMKNFSNRTKKHEGTKAHIAAAIAFELLGKPIIQLFICYKFLFYYFLKLISILYVLISLYEKLYPSLKIFKNSHRMHVLSYNFQNFPGGACPQTP